VLSPPYRLGKGKGEHKGLFPKKYPSIVVCGLKGTYQKKGRVLSKPGTTEEDVFGGISCLCLIYFQKNSFPLEVSGGVRGGGNLNRISPSSAHLPFNTSVLSSGGKS